jgi:hypothetical protein
VAGRFFALGVSGHFASAAFLPVRHFCQCGILPVRHFGGGAGLAEAAGLAVLLPTLDAGLRRTVM